MSLFISQDHSMSRSNHGVMITVNYKELNMWLPLSITHLFYHVVESKRKKLEHEVPCKHEISGFEKNEK